MQPTFISLESLEIASPCRAQWKDMQGDERARFCGTCTKNVYNLSAMTRDEAMRLIEAKEGYVCVRMYRRSDGTVLTSDCPVGTMVPKRARGFQLFAAAFGFLAVLFGVRSVLAARAQQQPVMLMGDIAPLPTLKATPKPSSTHTQHHGNASGKARNGHSAQK